MVFYTLSLSCEVVMFVILNATLEHLIDINNTGESMF